MSYIKTGPFVSGGAPGIDAGFLNNVEDELVAFSAESEVIDHGATSGTVTLDVTAGGVHKVTANGTLTIALASLSAGEQSRVSLYVTPAGHAVIWPAGIGWVGGPPQLEDGVNLVDLVSLDGGLTLYGTFVGGIFAPPAIGAPLFGGYYAGTIDTTQGNIIASDISQTGKRYALIVAGKSVEAAKAYSSSAILSSPQYTRWDGLTATQAMNSSGFPAAQYCAGLAHDADGASDWYLPAMDELELLYRHFSTSATNSTAAYTASVFPSTAQSAGVNPSSDPTGTAYTANSPGATTVAAFQAGGAGQFALQNYWSSTASQTQAAWSQDFANDVNVGRQYPLFGVTATSIYVRPVRRYEY